MLSFWKSPETRKSCNDACTCYIKKNIVKKKKWKKGVEIKGNDNRNIQLKDLLGAGWRQGVNRVVWNVNYLRPNIPRELWNMCQVHRPPLTVSTETEKKSAWNVVGWMFSWKKVRQTYQEFHCCSSGLQGRGNEAYLKSMNSCLDQTNRLLEDRNLSHLLCCALEL